MKEISDNVNEFINKCSEKIGEFEKECFFDNTFYEYEDLMIESPIEQILYCALKTVQRINLIEDDDPVEINGQYQIRGLRISPQKKIDKYRVDFLICYYARQSEKCIIVECDSQEWHERKEKERRYEKIRDRYLLKKDYRVFHYTGKEIIESPFHIAVEILEEVTPFEIEE